jgi:hypothetical protein
MGYQEGGNKTNIELAGGGVWFTLLCGYLGYTIWVSRRGG